MEYKEDNTLIRRNEKEHLYGKTKCMVCEREYLWEENINADAVVENVDCEGERVVCIGLNITSKCSHCNYKTKHYHKEKK